MFVHHVVIFDHALTHIKVKSFDFDLGRLEGTADHVVLDRLILGNFEHGHNARDLVPAKNAHQIIFEANIKTRTSGVTLAARAATELVVDTPTVVPLGT